MVWPTKYGTAASQLSTPPELPDRGDATAFDSLQSFQGAIARGANLLPPRWSLAPLRDLGPEFDAARLTSLEGVVFPPSTSPGARSEALLQVEWPLSAEVDKERFLNYLQIESRPAGATSWRSGVTTIYWDIGTNPNNPYEAFVFAAVPTDEYRAGVNYWFAGPGLIYSRINSVDTSTINAGIFEPFDAPTQGVTTRTTVRAFSQSTVIIQASQEERFPDTPELISTSKEYPTGFYVNFADPRFHEEVERSSFPVQIVHGNTTRSLTYLNFTV